MATVRGLFGDFKARIIKLIRRSKKHCAVVVEPCIAAGTIARFVAFAIFPVETHGYFSSLKCDAYFASCVAK